jgi:hypothetical protein
MECPSGVARHPQQKHILCILEEAIELFAFEITERLNDELRPGAAPKLCVLIACTSPIESALPLTVVGPFVFRSSL